MLNDCTAYLLEFHTHNSFNVFNNQICQALQWYHNVTQSYTSWIFYCFNISQLHAKCHFTQAHRLALISIYVAFSQAPAYAVESMDMELVHHVLCASFQWYLFIMPTYEGMARLS